jgi:hypothetical protein
MEGSLRVPTWSFIKCLASAKTRSALRSLSGYKRPRFELGSETPIQTFYDGPLFDPLGMRAGLKPISGIPPYGLPAPAEDLSWLAELGDIEFEVQPTRSFFGDCVNVVDAPNEQPLDSTLPPFGWSKPSLTDGLAITCSTLTGRLGVLLLAEGDGFVALRLTHGEGLHGVNSMLSAPSGYGLSVRENIVQDCHLPSHGKLELATGRLHDFHYNVEFCNTAINMLCALNPGLTPPPLLFPGLPHAGHTMGWIETTADRTQLVLHVIAQQFLPLGAGADGCPLQMPSSETSFGQATNFHAANSSLHPFISIVALAAVPTRLRTRAKGKPKSPDQVYRQAGILPTVGAAGSLADYQNKVVALRCIPGATDFGDNFDLRSPQLGGGALARSPLFGDLRIQFGTVVEGKLPFVLKLVSPTPRLLSKAKQLLSLLPPGTEPGLVGMYGELRFPAKNFLQRELSLTTDPYKVSIGVVDVATGAFDDMILRTYLFQNVMRNLLLVEPRTPTDSFCYICNGGIRPTRAGLLFRLYGEFTIPYPAGYAFPLPRGGSTKIEAGSHLLPFVNIEAVSADSFQPRWTTFHFKSKHRRRGRLDDTATLLVQFEGGNHVARLVDAFGQVEAIVTRIAVAAIESLEIIEIEMRVPNGRRRASEAIYGVAVVDGESAELLLVSERENFDTWLEGTLIRTFAPGFEVIQS